MCKYVSMKTCKCVSMYCKYVSMQVCIYVCMYVWMDGWTDVCMYRCMYVMYGMKYMVCNVWYVMYGM